jgi:hypothetical protein
MYAGEDELRHNKLSDYSNIDDDNTFKEVNDKEDLNTDIGQVSHSYRPESSTSHGQLPHDYIPEASTPQISGENAPASHSSPRHTTGKKNKYRSMTQSNSSTKQVGQASWFMRREVGIPVVAFCLCFAYYLQQDTETVLPTLSVAVSESEHEKLLRMDINNIRDEFPSQPKVTWGSFSSGIKMVQEDPTNPKPAVFLLLHETEEETAACLARKIGNITTHFLNAIIRHPLILEGVDFEHNETLVEDYGIMLEEYRSKVEKQRAVIVNNLHKIPGKVARSFHTFCDIETPLVNKAVYFFTMKASGVNHSRNNPTSLAEEELKKLWGGQLDEDTLIPLIVRITHMAMVIKPEGNLSSCYR